MPLSLCSYFSDKPDAIGYLEVALEGLIKSLHLAVKENTFCVITLLIMHGILRNFQRTRTMFIRRLRATTPLNLVQQQIFAVRRYCRFMVVNIRQFGFLQLLRYILYWKMHSNWSTKTEVKRSKYFGSNHPFTVVRDVSSRQAASHGRFSVNIAFLSENNPRIYHQLDITSCTAHAFTVNQPCDTTPV